MKDVDQSTVLQSRRHLSYGSRKGERQSQFPLLSSSDSGKSSLRYGKVLNKRDAFTPGSTVLQSSRSSVLSKSSSRSYSPNESEESRESVRFGRIQQTRVFSSENNATKPIKTDTTSLSLPSIFKNPPNIQEPRKNVKSSTRAPPITESVSDAEDLSTRPENSTGRYRCGHCGSTFHESKEHFSDNLVDKEQVRRIRMQRRRRRRRHKRKETGSRGSDKPKPSGTKRSRNSKNPKDSSPINGRMKSDKNDESEKKVPGYQKTTVNKITNTRNFTFRYSGSPGKTPIRQNSVVRNDLKEVSKNADSKDTKAKNLKPGAKVTNSCKKYKLHWNLLESKDDVTSTKVKTAEKLDGSFSKKYPSQLRKSKSLLSEKTAIRNARKRAEDVGNQIAHFAQNRSATIHGALGSGLDAMGTQRQSQRTATTRENTALLNHNLNAYHSIPRIPDDPRLKPPTDKQAPHVSASYPLLRHSNSVEPKKDSENSRSGTLSMKELTKYRKTMTIYIDAEWKKTRRDRFYHTLEDAQVKQWKEKKLAAIREQREARESKDKQLKQLRFIRNKHQNKRNVRLSTQHVKWKYVLGGMGSDRAQYGLPSEYFTYYGFAPDHINISKKRKNITVKMPRTGTARSATNARLDEGKDSMLPTELEMEEIRRRNKERYDHIFATRSRTQIDIIRNIIGKGLYTVEIEEEVDERTQTPTGNQSHTEIAGQNKSKSQLQKRTSRLLVKDVVNEAKRILDDVLDERYSDEFESKSDGDESDRSQFGK